MIALHRNLCIILSIDDESVSYYYYYYYHYAKINMTYVNQ